MTTREIETLLAKYYEGETTLQEEQSLRAFFQGEEIPRNLVAHKTLFRYFSEESASTPSGMFDETLQKNLQQGKMVYPDLRRKRLLYTLSLAAGILLVAALVTIFRLGIFTPSSPVGTITDPDLAYAETRNALILVSHKLNRGLDGVRQFQAFQTGMEEANKINKLDKYQPIIIHPDE